ncbi:BA75_02723T0 [Komagataella pastoris]|uniref:BA75_02723T0 n=1 Tax=Komagataella pastoris TaxID=4922 RepID=A0A1B2JDF8_PICPA|nr:BA75_02723T0 [Komagataella pastoris]
MAKRSKNQQRRLRAKLRKTQGVPDQENGSFTKEIPSGSVPTSASDDNDEVTIAQPDITGLEGPLAQEFQSIFAKFVPIEEKSNLEPSPLQSRKEEIIYSSSSEDEAESDIEQTQAQSHLSKKEKRKLYGMSLTELKTFAARPDLVEWYDADADDPTLNVYLKCLLRAVKVPAHWQSKRDYLSSKRGYEKPPFRLPDFIRDTGIMEMRDVSQEDESTLKQRTRDKVQPKMGKLDIDFQRLHDAFTKFQTKPPMLAFGDVYYEGRGSETFELENFVPGKVSSRLRTALGIANHEKPPWVVQMAKLGPPPSYPNMETDGVFKEPIIKNIGAPIERDLWGSIHPDSEEEDEDNDEEQEDEEEEQFIPRYDEESTDHIPIKSVSNEIPKMKHETVTETEDDSTDAPLYQVLSQKKESGGFMGEKINYELPSSKR